MPDQVDILSASRDELIKHLRKEIKANYKYAKTVAPHYPELEAYFNGTATQHKIALRLAGISEE